MDLKLQPMGFKHHLAFAVVILAVLVITPTVVNANTGTSTQFTPYTMGQPTQQGVPRPTIKPEQWPLNRQLADPNEETTITGGVSKDIQLTMTYRTEVLGRYERYRKRIDPMLKQLAQWETLLSTVNDPRDSLQELAALNNTTTLHWQQLEQNLEGFEPSLQSYESIRQSYLAMNKALTHWVAVEKDRDLKRPSQMALSADLVLWQSQKLAFANHYEHIKNWLSLENEITKNPNH